MRVLIVEDDPLLGDALEAGLKQRGFEPDWVQDGREAQTVIRLEPYAAVVLDLGELVLVKRQLGVALYGFCHRAGPRARGLHSSQGGRIARGP